MPLPPTRRAVLMCRPGWEAVLLEELALKQSVGAEVEQGAGWLAVPPGVLSSAPPLVFERQRLPAARWIPAPEGLNLEALAANIGALLADLAGPGTLELHALAPDEGEAAAPVKEVRALERRLLRAHPGRLLPPPDLARPALPAAPPPARVLQVLLTRQGCWVDASPRTALSSPWPGGVHRQAPDPLAPSRSFLKLEEALALMDASPRHGDKAVDLGAAPGGWSYALLRRGCRVLAVDNGPLKLRGLEQLPGALTHLRADGLSFRPPPGWMPLDWLVADMLVPPGAVLGLLRRWIGGGWVRHAVVNVKLPQRDPLVALAPLRDYLGSVRGLAWRLRQLYHDRREVTLMATLQGGPPSVPERAPRQAARPSPRSAARPGAGKNAGRGSPAPRRGKATPRRRRRP